MPGTKPEARPIAVLRNGDLDATVTVRQVLEICEALKDTLVSTVHAKLEHWSDDEGLHFTPFARDIEKDLPIDVDRAMATGLTEAMESAR